MSFVVVQVPAFRKGHRLWDWVEVLQNLRLPDEPWLNAAGHSSRDGLEVKGQIERLSTEPLISWKKSSWVCRVLQKNVRHLSVMRVTARDTCFQAFPLISYWEHNIFFLSFFPLKGCYIHCVQMQTEGDPEALCSQSVKENSKFISLYNSVSKGYVTWRSKEPWSKGQRARGLWCAAHSLGLFAKGQPDELFPDGNYHSLKAAGSQIRYGCGGKK